MSLPMPWVEKIFLKLTLTFGREFSDRWDEASLEDVKADWAHELRGFQQNPAAIGYGLEHCLAGKPPTVQEFKAVCLRHTAHVPMLPSPKADPAVVAQVMGQLRVPQAAMVDHKAWAKRLRDRHQAGEKFGRYQIQSYMQVLGGAS